MTSTISTDTKEQILNVAEKLFAENGFAGTSLRSVIREADVNLSAVHYHFGSKEELFRAVVVRTAQPIVKETLKRLAQCQAKYENPSVEAILEAFLTPPLQIILSSGDRSINCARFMGRSRTEPDSIRGIAEQEFQDIQEAYLDALGRSLPDLSRTELTWKLDLVIAVLLRVLTEARKPDALIQDNSPEGIQNTVSKLIDFLAPGMRS
ncbi:Transcriptional regulator [Hyella patelloides LEGE 07179]|uniref:Transcriptional regulator n=1 Tax=Hyella patelloides LEGE 07179 TaxID=945734 RepID=A0A563VTE4_9CYAN|nr:TetR/AcrR family transcriptional regulator [Hyella patelloides]VEP14683.1 Transcriptional regulator [Hyella patelloides LEGE 07179]